MRVLAPTREGLTGPPGAQVHYAAYEPDPVPDADADGVDGPDGRGGTDGRDGTDAPTVVLLMPDVITHARAWKAQVPFLARSCRVLTLDPLGNGGSDRSVDPAAFATDAVIARTWSALDALDVDQVVLCGVCSGAGHALLMAAERPGRVRGVVAINPGLPLTPPHPWKVRHDFETVLDEQSLAAAVAADGWARLNRRSWQLDWPGFAQFFFEQLFPEPHSTKQIEDCVGWANETTAAVMLADNDAPPSGCATEEAARAACAAVRCPVLVLVGTQDRCQVPQRGRIVAALTRGQLVELEGAGHLPMARDPVRVNLLLREFLTTLRTA